MHGLCFLQANAQNEAIVLSRTTIQISFNGKDIDVGATPLHVSAIFGSERVAKVITKPAYELIIFIYGVIPIAHPSCMFRCLHILPFSKPINYSLHSDIIWRAFIGKNVLLGSLTRFM